MFFNFRGVITYCKKGFELWIVNYELWIMNCELWIMIDDYDLWFMIMIYDYDLWFSAGIPIPTPASAWVLSCQNRPAGHVELWAQRRLQKSDGPTGRRDNLEGKQTKDCTPSADGVSGQDLACRACAEGNVQATWNAQHGRSTSFYMFYIFTLTTSQRHPSLQKCR